MIHSITNNKLYLTVDTFGSEMVSLRDVHSTEYIWQGESVWSGHAPILFPTVGGLKNGKTMINSKEYKLQHHGFARKSDFRVAEKSTDKLCLRLTENQDTLKVYPFKFTFDVIFELIDNTLVQTFRITNEDKYDMPYGVGGHPAFNVPIGNEDKFEDYIIKFPVKETVDSPVKLEEERILDTSHRQKALENSDTIRLKHSLFEKGALILETLVSRRVEMYSTVTGRGVRMNFDGFDYFGIWQMGNADYICLEPWTCTDDRDIEYGDFSLKRGIKVLAPGETAEHTFSVEIL